MMADVSELRMVNGVTPELYAQLRPWVCTLPEAKPTMVNINTLAPEQAPLVAMAQVDTISPATIAQALLRRPPQGYADVSAFWAQVSGASGGGNVATTTRWFNLRIDVGVGGIGVQERALVDATRQPPRWWRGFGGKSDECDQPPVPAAGEGGDYRWMRIEDSRVAAAGEGLPQVTAR